MASHCLDLKFFPLAFPCPPTTLALSCPNLCHVPQTQSLPIEGIIYSQDLSPTTVQNVCSAAAMRQHLRAKPWFDWTHRSWKTCELSTVRAVDAENIDLWHLFFFLFFWVGWRPTPSSLMSQLHPTMWNRLWGLCCGWNRSSCCLPTVFGGHFVNLLSFLPWSA